jgi:LAO/AO transport system kinase
MSAEGVLRGNRRALAQALTVVERGGPDSRELLRDVFPHTGGARVLGVTGPGGAGKSTLINALVRAWREQSETVGVISVDPSSQINGGAVLGDRIRLQEHTLDAGTFIRSMASRGALGGLAETTFLAALVMDAAGKDRVILETVGVGQAEVDIAHCVDTVVLVLNAGAGDDVQAIKAGVMEIPDLIVVSKADAIDPTPALADLKGALHFSRREVPVLAVDALTGRGIEELGAAIDAHWDAGGDGLAREARRLANLERQVTMLAMARMRGRIEAELAAEDDAETMASLGARRIDPLTAAEAVLEQTAMTPVTGETINGRP